MPHSGESSVPTPRPPAPRSDFEQRVSAATIVHAVTPDALSPDASQSPEREHKDEYVQSLERGMRVLLSFSAEHPSRTLSDIARDTGLNRATARRLLLTFAHLGFVAHDGRSFSLTPKMLDLGFSYLASLSVVDVANPVMRRLTDEIHETSSLCVLDGRDVVFVARSAANRLMVLSAAVGYRVPAHLTSMGRVLVAFLSSPQQERWLEAYTTEGEPTRDAPNREQFVELLRNVRQAGWVLVDGELEQGLRTIAAPIFDSTGQCVAAMNIATHSARVTRDELRDQFLPPLLQATSEINRALGAR